MLQVISFSFFPVIFTMIIYGFSAGVFLGFFKAFSLHRIKRKMNKVLLLIQTYGIQRIFLVAKQPVLEFLPLAHPSHRQKGQDLRHMRPIQTAVKTPSRKQREQHTQQLHMFKPLPMSHPASEVYFSRDTVLLTQAAHHMGTDHSDPLLYATHYVSEGKAKLLV